MFTVVRSLGVVAVLLPSLLAAAPAMAPATQPGGDPLAQLVAELHARGEPAVLEDLRPAAVRPEENAAILYEKAAEALDPRESGPRSSAESFKANLPYPAAWHRLAAENVRRNGAAFDMVRQAATRPAVAWTAAPTGDWMTQVLQGLSGQRALANAVADAALYVHFTGNDRDAVGLLREELRHADAVGRKPLLVSKLVMIGLDAMATNNAQIISTELTVEGSKHPLRADAKSPASRAAVQGIIGELLNDSSLVAPWRRTFGEERVYAIDQFRHNGFPAPQAAKSLQAISTLYDAYAAAADKPSWAANVAVPDDPFVKILAPSFGKAQEVVTRVLLVRRMAAISLAVALYRNDQGQFPPDLAALVPGYLSAVPVDPYSRNGQAIQYAVIDGNRPMIGSVGPDGQDGAVPQVGLPPDVHYGFYKAPAGEPDDVWMDLSAWAGK